MRDIKEVLRGFIPSSDVKEWDVTPTVSVTTVTFENEGTYNALFDNGLLNFNGISNPAPINLGVMKTNITMDLLAGGDTFRFSLRMADILVEGARFAGMAILPGDLSAEQAHTLLTGLFGGTGSLPAPNVLNLTLVAGASKESPVLGKLQTPTPVEVPIALSSELLDGFTLDTDYVEHLFLRKTSNSLYVAKELVDSDGSTYDIVGTPAINDVVFNDSLRLYIWGGSIIMGGGLASNHANFYIEPTFDIVPISTLVAGTTYEAAGGTQDTFNQDYPSIKRPLITTVTQKTFPAGTRRLELYKTKVTGSVSVPIEPYGISVQENQLVLINNTTPLQENFTPLVDSLTLSDYLAPIANQQESLVQTVSDLALLVQQSAADVNRALINANEMVVYVRQDGSADPSFDSNVTFNSLDEAYSFLVAFAKHIKKRIVIDDRDPIGGTYGTAEYIYYLKQNNIVLSTYLSFIGKSPFVYPVLGSSGSLSTLMHGIYDGLQVEKFEGNFNATIIRDTDTSENLLLKLTESFLSVSIHNFDNTYANRIVHQQNSCLALGLDFTRPVEEHPSIIIEADETSPVDFSDYSISSVQTGQGFANKITLKRYGCVRADNISTGLASLQYINHVIPVLGERTPGKLDAFVWQMNLVNSDTIVVRNKFDFGQTNENLLYRIINSVNNYIVVGSVDLQDFSLRPFNNINIVGLGDAVIKANQTLIELINSNVSITINNCKLLQTSVSPTTPLLNLLDSNGNAEPRLKIKDCVIDARNPLTMQASMTLSSVAATLELTDVVFKNYLTPIQLSAISRIDVWDCKFELIAANPGSIIYIAMRNIAFQVRNLINIDGVDILTSGADASGNLPAIINFIEGTYIPSETINPYIYINNVHTFVTHNNVFYPEIVVYNGYALHDYFADTNFDAQQIGGYAFADGNINYDITEPSISHIGAFFASDSQVRLFQINNFGMTYFGLKQKRFLVELTGRGQVPTNSCAINLKRRLTNSIVGVTIDQPLVLETQLFTNVQNTLQTFKLKRVVTLSNIHSLVLEATNNVDSQDFGFEVSWSITEL